MELRANSRLVRYIEVFVLITRCDSIVFDSSVMSIRIMVFKLLYLERLLADNDGNGLFKSILS